MTGAAPSAEPSRPEPARSSWRRTALWGLGGLGVLGAGMVLYQWLTWPDVAALATRRPETTAFIEAAKQRHRVAWTWVSGSAISVHLKRAALSAEDLEFFLHQGFSGAEMKAAIREALAEGRAPRGASTITQQLAKNLWLSPSRNPWRKVKEALLTRALEKHLTKRRVLDIYLNVVEFGPGVYGAEAAARHYFGKPAAELIEHEAALLAASLPRPSTWHPGSESRAYARYVAEVENRMARAAFLWKYLGEAPPIALPESLVIPESLLVPIIPPVDSPPDSTSHLP